MISLCMRIFLSIKVERHGASSKSNTLVEANHLGQRTPTEKMKEESWEIEHWKSHVFSWFDFGVITLRQLSTGLWPWTGVSTLQTAGKSAIFVFCCRFAQGLQGHHLPTGRVAGRGTGSHGGREATGAMHGLPRWRHRWAHGRWNGREPDDKRKSCGAWRWRRNVSNARHWATDSRRHDFWIFFGNYCSGSERMGCWMVLRCWNAY